MLESNIFDIHKNPQSITIIFNSTMENVDRTCDETVSFLTDFFRSYPCSENSDADCASCIRSHIFAIQLVMREGLTNAVRHGNASNSSKMVKFSVQIDDNQLLRMEIEDQGQGFNWRQEKKKDMDDTSDHGRGLIIMEQYFTKYWYNEKGNKLILEKLISFD